MDALKRLLQLCTPFAVPILSASKESLLPQKFIAKQTHLGARGQGKKERQHGRSTQGTARWASRHSSCTGPHGSIQRGSIYSDVQYTAVEHEHSRALALEATRAHGISPRDTPTWQRRKCARRPRAVDDARRHTPNPAPHRWRASGTGSKAVGLVGVCTTSPSPSASPPGLERKRWPPTDRLPHRQTATQPAPRSRSARCPPPQHSRAPARPLQSGTQPRPRARPRVRLRTHAGASDTAAAPSFKTRARPPARGSSSDTEQLS